ncbi:MAG TPA: MFS transporter [Bdellovibrio sp.]|uniref:MFS transporter n=1 Tax=Bdellovibrio sp. TaxID=28201 RepID=UPI002EE36159
MERESAFISLWDELAMLCLVNLLAFYCFYLSGVLYIDSTTMFFNPETTGFAKVSSLLTFLLGFVLRPVGAVFYGVFADLRGRQRALISSLYVISISTVLIGLLPSYAQMGDLSTILNILLRGVQGFALGGSYACAAVLAYEIAPFQQKARYTSVIQLSITAGFLTAIAIIVILKLLCGIDAFLAWGWRICFLMSGLIILAIRRLNRSLVVKEAPIMTLKEWHRNVTKPFFLSKKSFHHFIWFMIPVVGGLGIAGYVSHPYKLYFLQSILKVEPSTVSFIVAISSVFYMPTNILWGYVGDKVNRKNLLLIGLAACLVLCYPLFMLMDYWVKNHPMIGGQILSNTMVLILISALISALPIIGYGPMIAYICEHVPAKARCTAVAVVYNLGFGIFSGVISLATGYWYEKYNWSFAGIAIAEVVFLICLLFAISNYPKKSMKHD